MADSGDDSGLRAKLVDGASDLTELRATVGDASGRLISARRGVGDEVLLRVRPSIGQAPDDWRIGSQASDWVLASPSSIMAGAHASPEAIDAALDDLAGADVTRSEVTDNLALVVIFSDGRWLEVQGLVNDVNERDDDPPYWEVFTPTDEILRAGPGPIWVRSASVVRTPTSQPVAGSALSGVEGLADDELLMLWSSITAELRRRGIMKTDVPLGDLAEELVRKHFGGFRGSYDRAGWDVLTKAGERIEVKAVQQRKGSARLPSLALRSDGEFDALVIVAFDEALSVQWAWHIPRDVVMSHLSESMNRNSARRLRLREVLNEPSISALQL